MSRGRKKPSLRDLNKRHLTNDEFDIFARELAAGTDRSAALVGSAFVEFSMYQALASTMLFYANDELDRLFFAPDSPLAGLAAKTKIATAIGLIHTDIAEYINAIRRIRNAFAHTFKPLFFTDDLVSKEIEILLEDLQNLNLSRGLIRDSGLDDSVMSEQRFRYCRTCMTISLGLEGYVYHNQMEKSKIRKTAVFQSWEDMKSWRKKYSELHPGA